MRILIRNTAKQTCASRLGCVGAKLKKCKKYKHLELTGGQIS